MEMKIPSGAGTTPWRNGFEEVESGARKMVTMNRIYGQETF